MLLPAEKNKIIEDTKQMKTVKEVFDYLNAKFETENTTIGMVAKPLFVDGLIKCINLLNPKKRQ
jgi:predicted transcriptional regulator